MTGTNHQRHGFANPTGVRDGLRALRFVARQGRDSLRRNAPERALPWPLSGLARNVLQSVDRSASAVANLAEGTARNLIGRRPDTDATLSTIERHQRAEEYFAEATYAGLRRALRLLGAENSLVLESRARRAYTEAIRSAPAGEEELAARLMARLLDDGAVREVVMARPSRIDAPRAPALACFAVIMWLICDRFTDNGDDLLETCVELALALDREIEKTGGDPLKIAALVAEFHHHV